MSESKQTVAPNDTDAQAKPVAEAPVGARDDGGDDSFDNLQALCKACHSSKTAKDKTRRRANRPGEVEKLES